MGTIIGIGGGEIATKETLQIDQHILSLSAKKNPQVLFIPAASGDSQGYCTGFSAYYQSLGAQVSVLLLHSSDMNQSIAQSMIANADIIHVGGGNTKKLIDVINKFDLVPVFLKFFAQDNKVLCGISAGCLCWFEFGMSDYIPGKWTFIECLGLLKGACSVGFSRPDSRQEEFTKRFSEFSQIGFGVSDKSAIIATNKMTKNQISFKGNVEVFTSQK